MSFPNRVWVRSRVVDGVQLYYSRPVTEEDEKRRKQFMGRQVQRYFEKQKGH